MGGFNVFHYGLVFYLPLKENIDTHERGRQNNNGSNVFDALLTLDLYMTFAHPFHSAKTGMGRTTRQRLPRTGCRPRASPRRVYPA
jgi:hypothetical protein